MAKQKEDPKFNSLGEVKKHFPLYQTAILHTVKPLARGEIFYIHRDQAQARRKFAPIGAINGRQVGAQPPPHSGSIDLVGLAGRVVIENAVALNPDVVKSVGPIFINHRYGVTGWREALQDYQEGDLVTIFYINITLTGSTWEPHARYVFNHNTNALCHCIDDLAMFSYDDADRGISIPPSFVFQIKHVVAAIMFLKANNLILVQRPRLFQDSVFYEYDPDPTRVKACGTCLLNTIICIVVFIIFINLFMYFF